MNWSYEIVNAMVDIVLFKIWDLFTMKLVKICFLSFNQKKYFSLL